DEYDCFDNWECYDQSGFVNPGFLCDGTDDCADGSDEGYCNGDFFSCDGDTVALQTQLVCDGEVDCADGTDEDYCFYTFTCADGIFGISRARVCDGNG